MADDLRTACQSLMRAVSVGGGMIVCPPALEPSVRAIYEALKEQPCGECVGTGKVIVKYDGSVCGRCGGSGSV